MIFESFKHQGVFPAGNYIEISTSIREFRNQYEAMSRTLHENLQSSHKLNLCVTEYLHLIFPISIIKKRINWVSVEI